MHSYLQVLLPEVIVDQAQGWTTPDPWIPPQLPPLPAPDKEVSSCTMNQSTVDTVEFSFSLESLIPGPDCPL